MTVLIKLKTNINSELFNLYSDIDGYVSPFEIEIPKSSILEGITSLRVPDGTTIIRVMSDSLSNIYIDTPINSIDGFNFTSIIPPPPALPLI